MNTELKQIINNFKFIGTLSNIEENKQGNINKTYILTYKNKNKTLKYLLQEINANVFKEHEIMFEDNDNHYHGFIDLLLEYEDHFDIVDYKLSNIDSDEYEKQLSGYKKYIEKKYNKPTNIYLYSINQDILKKLQ